MPGRTGFHLWTVGPMSDALTLTKNISLTPSPLNRGGAHLHTHHPSSTSTSIFLPNAPTPPHRGPQWGA